MSSALVGCDFHFARQPLSSLILAEGTGLVGIVSALAGASTVTISDYPSPVILKTLKHNVTQNVKNQHVSGVNVQGHDWGTFTDHLSQSEAASFTRILSADCIWMLEKQEHLLATFRHFLSDSPSARVWIVAGFHTGRQVVTAFFERAVSAGFEIEQRWERDVNGNERAWADKRDAVEDDIEYRRQWLVIASLKRPTVAPPDFSDSSKH